MAACGVERARACTAHRLVACRRFATCQWCARQPMRPAADTGAPAAAARAGISRVPQDGQIDLSASAGEHRAPFLPDPAGASTEPAVGYGGGLARGMFADAAQAQRAARAISRPNISGHRGVCHGEWNEGRRCRRLEPRRIDEAPEETPAGRRRRSERSISISTAWGLTAESLDEPVSYSLDFSGRGRCRGGGSCAPTPRGGSRIPLRVRERRAESSMAIRRFPALPTPASRVDVSAPGAASTEYDSRDNTLHAHARRVFAETFYMLSREDLGASEDFERRQPGCSWAGSRSRDRVTFGLRGDYQWSSEERLFWAYIKLRGGAMRPGENGIGGRKPKKAWQAHGRWSL